MTTISYILYICGDENQDDVYATAESMVKTKALMDDEKLVCSELVAICADNCDAYREELEQRKITVLDLSGTDYATVAQFKNAAVSYTSGDYLIYAAPGDAVDADELGRLMDSEEVTFEQLLANGAGRLQRIAIPRTFIEEYAGFNERLGCGEDFELAARALAEADDGLKENMKVRVLISEQPCVLLYQEHYRMYAYLFGKYAAKLKSAGSFDVLLERYLKEADSYGIGQYFTEQLEKMIAKKAEYYSIDDATRPVVIYMGDPICFDVLKSFAHEFSDSLRKCGIPVIMYDMSEKGTQGLAQFVENRYRAAVGFQTALFSVRLKDSQELVNNMIEAPKFNFLYDHPLYLYYHFTLPLRSYYVLTQDENYAAYINRHYPAVKKSWHLPPAGIELPEQEQTAWKDRIYDIVFVASYHDYRERMAALERECKPDLKDTAYRLLEEMKNNPDETSEEALEKVLAECAENEAYGIHGDMGVTDGSKMTPAITDRSFAETLTDCMDVCRIVMFYYREKVIETILDAGITIHVFGSSWNNCPLADRDNLIIHPDVSYREGIKIMGQAKIALNIMSWHKAGMTERIANTMLNHTVCLTDKTTYLEKHFTDGSDIVMYDLARLGELPDIIRSLLADDYRMKAIADAGYDSASANHRWINRARDFISLLSEI